MKGTLRLAWLVLGLMAYSPAGQAEDPGPSSVEHHEQLVAPTRAVLAATLLALLTVGAALRRR
jgi:hypothetical protein